MLGLTGRGKKKKGANPRVSRRRFLKVAAGTIAATATVSTIRSTAAIVPKIIEQTSESKPSVSMSNARIAHDPELCVGCRLCELACSTYNDGISKPQISRIQVDAKKGLALWIHGLFLGAGTCYQCVEPACLNACPFDVIKVDTVRGNMARVVEERECRAYCIDVCRGACPWDIPRLKMSGEPLSKGYNRPGSPFQSTTGIGPVMVKCNLCWGDPQCVKICPAGALSILYT